MCPCGPPLIALFSSLWSDSCPRGLWIPSNSARTRPNYAEINPVIIMTALLEIIRQLPWIAKFDSARIASGMKEPQEASEFFWPAVARYLRAGKGGSGQIWCVFPFEKKKKRQFSIVRTERFRAPLVRDGAGVIFKERFVFLSQIQNSEKCHSEVQLLLLHWSMAQSIENMALRLLVAQVSTTENVLPIKTLGGNKTLGNESQQ